MTLIAAYKTLGGSFTGDLTVDPGHLREQRRNAREDATNPDPESSIAERRRRTRDAVEAALSDVILLGTEEQVLMATQVANDMVAGAAWKPPRWSPRCATSSARRWTWIRFRPDWPSPRRVRCG